MNFKPLLKLWLGRCLERLPKSVRAPYWNQNKPRLTKEQTQQLDKPFHPFTLLWMSDRDPFPLAHAVEATDSGAAVLKADIRARMGGLLMRLRNQ